MSYYLTKSNPNVYKLQDALNYYRNVADVSWTICKDAELGDILFIGQSGEEAGIYAKAIVADYACFEAPDDPRFWVNPEGARKAAWMAPLESLNLIEPPILEENLRATPKLGWVVEWLHRQGKACHLTDEKGEAIDRLIEASSAA